MKARVALALAALAACSVPAGAQDADDWSRFATPSGMFSAEVPCSAEEIAKFAALPADVGIPMPLEPTHRVFCQHEGWIYVAGIVSASALDVMDKSVFDWIKGGVLATKDRDGEPRELTVDGNRAFINRETSEDYRADAGFIELDETTVVFFTSGGPTRKDFDMEAAMDRFAQSIRIAAR